MSDQERPPFFSTWRRMYIAVLVNLVLVILLFYIFMIWFS